MKWEDLVGDERRRFCGACDKHVYNLETLEPEELVAIVEETEGRFCGRLYRRPKELTVMTSHCSVGIRTARRQVVGRAALAVAAVAGATYAAAPADAPPMALGVIEPAQVEPPPAPPPEPVVMEAFELGEIEAEPVPEPPARPAERLGGLMPVPSPPQD